MISLRVAQHGLRGGSRLVGASARNRLWSRAPVARALSSSGAPSEEHTFQAETRQLLDIVTNSLYTDKEVCGLLRVAISFVPRLFLLGAVTVSLAGSLVGVSTRDHQQRFGLARKASPPSGAREGESLLTSTTMTARPPTCLRRWGWGPDFVQKTTISNLTQVTGASLANPDAALEIVLETNQAAGTLTIRCVGWRATSQQSHPRPKVLVATAHSKAPHAALLKLNSPRLAFFCVANLSSLSLFHSRTRVVVVVTATRAWA
jgi:hypothetical protein